MLGVDHQRAIIGEVEPGTDPGVFWRVAMRFSSQGGSPLGPKPMKLVLSPEGDRHGRNRPGSPGVNVPGVPVDEPNVKEVTASPLLVPVNAKMELSDKPPAPSLEASANREHPSVVSTK